MNFQSPAIILLKLLIRNRATDRDSNIFLIPISIEVIFYLQLVPYTIFLDLA